MAFQDVFQRFEKKYIITEEKYQILMKMLSEYVVPDKYGRSTICNIYYDTPDHRLIRKSLEKPIYKEKLRVRSYGIPDGNSTVFVELKKKYKGIVYKRRSDMTLDQSKAFFNDSFSTKKNVQIENELKYFLSYYPHIAPAMFISYERNAFYGITDKNLRITFDRRITYRENELELDKGVWGRELLNPGQCLMEIKVPEAFPLWLSHMLDELKIYPSSFSKYGKAYLKTKGTKSKKDKVNNCA